MKSKFLYAITFLSLLVAPILTPIALCQNEGQNEGQNEAGPTVDADKAWKTLLAVEQTMFENLLSPPARQQMYLAATQGLYRANRFGMQVDLPAKFSKSTERDEFKKLFLSAWNTVSQKTKFDAAQSLNQSATAMLQCAGGSTSRFLSADEYRVTSSIKENQYVGIGIQIGMHEDIPVILKSFYGGAAHLAGAGSKDLIIEVDGNPTKGRELGEVVNDLRGPMNSKVTVKVQNIGSDEFRDYEMTRTVIPIDSVEGVGRNDDGQWKLTLGSEPEIAILNFTSIVGSTSAELTQMARRIEQQKLDKVVMDMRSVATADMHHVVLLADALLDNQKLGTVSDSKEEQQLETRAGSVFSDDVQIAILTPGHVDGATLMLFANLKNRPNVALVGKNIVSSGLVTNLFPLPDGLGAVNELPHALCFTPLANVYRPTAPTLNHSSYISNMRYQVESDMGVDATSEEHFRIALDALKNETVSKRN